MRESAEPLIFNHKQLNDMDHISKTERPARWQDCVKVSEELDIRDMAALNSLPRIEKTAFDFPQDATGFNNLSYIALFEPDKAVWVMTDDQGRVLLAFEFPVQILKNGPFNLPKVKFLNYREAEELIEEHRRKDPEAMRLSAEIERHISMMRTPVEKVASVDPFAERSEMAIEKSRRAGIDYSAGVSLIMTERYRQIQEKGFTAKHDANFRLRQLAKAARAYLGHYVDRAWMIKDEMGAGATAEDYRKDPIPDEWPEGWPESFWKPKGKISDLVRAGALIAAEIDRLIAANETEGFTRCSSLSEEIDRIKTENSEDLARRARIAGYRKQAGPITPDQDDDLREGDVIYCFGRGSALGTVVKITIWRQDIPSKCGETGECFWSWEAALAALTRKKESGEAHA